MEGPKAYPVKLSVDYPDREMDRITTLFRIFAIIPIAIILGLISGASQSWEGQEGVRYQYAAGGLIVAATVLMIVFRQKYPRWWFDWNVALINFSTRVSAYLALLRDEYPSTDEEQAVHITIPYPNVKEELNRWLPLVKWFLAIPHYTVLAFLAIGVIVAVIIAWFAILINGRYPKSLFDYVVGVMRWGLRVSAYAAILVTDIYPPFSLEE